MSVLDLILAQKGILLTAGIALLLLVVAVMLSVIPRVQKAAQARARGKVVRAAQKQIQQQRQSAAAATPPEPVEQPETVVAPIGPAVPAVTAPAPAEAPANPAALSPEAILNQALTAPENQPEQPAQDSASKEMQSILSSVFGDDETTAKFDMLLKGLEPVNIEHLLALSIQVAEQLHGQSGS